MGHCEQTESASLPPVSSVVSSACNTGVTAKPGAGVLCCVLCAVTVLLQFVASRKVNNFEALHGGASCYQRQQLCVHRKCCAPRGLPAPAWMAARSCSSSPDSLSCPVGSPPPQAVARWGAGDAGILAGCRLHAGQQRQQVVLSVRALPAAAAGAPLGPPPPRRWQTPGNPTPRRLFELIWPHADDEISYFRVFQKH